MDASADDAVALRRLVDLYGMTVDQRDAAGFTDLFEPDAVLQVYYGPEEAGPSTESHGHDDLAAIPPRVARRFARTFHFVGNHVCDVDGDAATGQAYCLAHHMTEGAVGGTDHVMVIRYDDRYRRGPDSRWRFAHRRVLVDWTELRTVNPPAAAGRGRS